MNILYEFLVRLACGMSAAMALTPARHVSGGYFRNHLYVVLGILTLASLAASGRQGLLWGTVLLAAGAYVGAALWLYHAARAGKIVLWLLAAGCLAMAYVGSVSALPRAIDNGAAATAIHLLNVATASGLLGLVMVCMLLGHWYLNAPEMEIAPLWRLLTLTYACWAARLVLCGGVFAWGVVGGLEFPQTVAWLLVLRWLCGFVGLAGALWMARQTLKIPNTQSATGLLYVAVFAVLAGEIVSLLLSAQYPFVL